MKKNRQVNYHSWWFAVTLVCAGSGFALGAELLGAEVQSIQTATSLPDSIPWDLKKLSVAPDYTWGAGVEVRSLYYAGEPYQGNPTRVFAYYATPDTLAGQKDRDERFPAIVLVHGGGGTAFPQWVKLWAERGYAAIAMDLAGNGPDKKRLSDGGPGQGHDMKFETIGQSVSEQWTYHAVSNVIRAHSLIQSFDEVDSKRTAVTGISWGGYLTCIVAGLDNRFQVAVPVYGCGFLHENSAWLGDFAKMSEEERNKWIEHWEPSRYVGSASMPMLFVNGGKDFAYPPDSHAKTFALVQSPKHLHFVPDLPHGHIFDRPKAIERFIDHHLRSGPALPQILAGSVGDGKVTATVESQASLQEARIHYTEDSLSGDAKKRIWTTKAADVEANAIWAKAPPESASAWFFTVKDENGVLVSSPLNIDGWDEPTRQTEGLIPNTEKTQREVLTALGAKLQDGATEVKRTQYRRIFRMLDTNGDDQLTREEFVDNGRYASRRVRAGIFRATDQDRNDLLTESEYVFNRIVTDEAKQIMDRMDSNGDGSVSRNEFLEDSPIANEEWADEVFSALDSNGDGVLQMPEYLRVWGKWARSAEGRESTAN